MQQFGSLKPSSGFHSVAGFWLNTHLGLNLEARFVSATDPLLLSALCISQASPAPLHSPSKALHPKLPLPQCALMPPPRPPGALGSGQCARVSRCKMISEMLLPRLQVLKRIGKFGSTLCCFGARSVR